MKLKINQYNDVEDFFLGKQIVESITGSIGDKMEMNKQIINTQTGKDFEDILKISLKRGGYSIIDDRKPFYGVRVEGGKHIPDIVVKKDDYFISISAKYQQTDGTVRNKIPSEIIDMIKYIEEVTCVCKYYLVLGGLKLDNFPIDAYEDYIELLHDHRDSGVIVICHMQEFIEKANRGKL